MLAVKHSAKGFYRIDLQRLKNLDSESQEIIRHINATWADIEYLNYLFHKNFGRLSDDPEIDHTFSALVVFGDSFYVHLSTIDKLMDKLGQKHRLIKRLTTLNNKFLKKRIQIIRNNILVHKEKPDFKTPFGEGASTDPAHLIERQIWVRDKDGSKKTYVLKPLKDIYLMSRLLENVERLLLAENNKRTDPKSTSATQ